ncbi:5-hydroxytryptamine receptor 3A-like [Cynoglossus semilaevis]|uniref:5-hydroxytryptamine receptor 3A-like n=1 Tax=Cynoglossus semilaevis TaxID=244447 RepID=UPI000D6290C3|nr:5-hydroxytryptamine receptor 3A-like [Cynoglossus semilaevis]
MCSNYLDLTKNYWRLGSTLVKMCWGNKPHLDTQNLCPDSQYSLRHLVNKSERYTTKYLLTEHPEGTRMTKVSERTTSLHLSPYEQASGRKQSWLDFSDTAGQRTETHRCHGNDGGKVPPPSFCPHSVCLGNDRIRRELDPAFSCFLLCIIIVFWLRYTTSFLYFAQSSTCVCVAAVSGDVDPEANCSYQDVLNYLNLTKNNQLYSMTRPVRDYRRPTQVSLEVALYAILDMVEKEQKFIPFVWTVMWWQNEYISWDPNRFCGIINVSLPSDILWTPDLTIEEMTEKDKAPKSPYLTISYNGDVEIKKHQVLVSTCRMHIYTFPFDIQSCNLSFKSVIYTAKDIRLKPSDNSSEATTWSMEVMRTQYEWLFINISVTTKNASDLDQQDIIVYTINMRRRSTLYIVNFILPILFFLCLDLASFMISDNSGEKLSFQVTVLLAITVLQLILNEILPSSSNRIPLIAVYCIGVFTLMMLSLLETILIMYLREKDRARLHDGSDKELGLKESSNKQERLDFQNYHRGETMLPIEMHTWTEYGHIYDGATETSPEQLSMAIEHNSNSRLVEDNHVLAKVSDELKEMERTLGLLLSTRTDHKPGYWSRLAKKVNKVFFITYVIIIIIFLSVLFLNWNID